MTAQGVVAAQRPGAAARVKLLAGSGDRIALFTLPFAAVGIVASVLFASVFRVGGRRRGCRWSPSSPWSPLAWRSGS
jgi:hypothetical protein